MGRQEKFLFSQECEALGGSKHEARRMTCRGVKKDEILVGVVGCTMTDGVRKERQATASDSRRGGSLKAGPITECASLKDVTKRNQFPSFRVGGAESPNVVRRREGVGFKRAHEPPHLR